MPNQYVTVGKVGAPKGVKGWVKITSYTEIPDQIFDFDSWLVGTEKKVMVIAEHQRQSDKLIARFEQCTDRNSAQELTNRDIVVKREQLPELGENQHYWSDLEGLAVTTTDDVMLGEVVEIFSTGSNDVLIVEGKKRHLIPFIKEEVIIQVDMPEKRIVVNWDPEF